MQLSPNENFPIFHGIINHLDTETYYVQTVIYDTNYNVLATVNLEDQGSQNFLKMWKVVYDAVYQRGKWILLVTSTYTDSGYTTKSENYGDEFDSHLIQERWDPNRFSPGIGGGEEIDYEKIEEIVKKIIGEPKKETEEEPLNTEKLIEDLTKSINDTRPDYPKIPEFPKFPEIPKFPEFPEIPKTDLSGIEKGIEELKLRPKFEKTDLTGIITHLEQLEKMMPESVKESIDNLKIFFANEFSKIADAEKEKKKEEKRKNLNTIRNKHNT